MVVDKIKIEEAELTEEQMQRRLLQEQAEIEAYEWQERMQLLLEENYDPDYGDVIV